MFLDRAVESKSLATGLRRVRLVFRLWGYSLILFASSNVLATNYPGRIAAVGWPGETLLGNPCWGQDKAYGPYDYTKTSVANRHLVEGYHFTPEVEQLIKGRSASILGDLDYTLRAFPNHPRALWAYVRLYLKDKRDLNQKRRDEYSEVGKAPPECYFQRAIKAVPDDQVVRVIYGTYLHQRDELEAALKQYKAAEQNLSGYAELFYNMGLLYMDIGDIDNAKQYADKADQLGYPLKGLEARIRRHSATVAE